MLNDACTYCRLQGVRLALCYSKTVQSSPSYWSARLCVCVCVCVCEGWMGVGLFGKFLCWCCLILYFPSTHTGAADSELWDKNKSCRSAVHLLTKCREIFKSAYGNTEIILFYVFKPNKPTTQKLQKQRDDNNNNNDNNKALNNPFFHWLLPPHIADTNASSVLMHHDQYTVNVVAVQPRLSIRPVNAHIHTYTRTHARKTLTTPSRKPRSLFVWAVYISPGLPTPCCWFPHGKNVPEPP